MIVVAPGVTLATARPTAGGFARHTHDEYVISTNLMGRESVRLDTATFDVGTREVTVYNPGQVQSCTTATPPGQTWACLSLYVSAPVACAWSGGSQPEARRPVVADPSLRAALLQAGAAAQSAGRGRADGLQDRQLLAERLEVFFGQVMAAATGRPAAVSAAGTVGAERVGPAWVQQVRDRLADDLTGPVDLHELAQEVGRSREHLIRCFTAVHGCPPYAWQLAARLARARSQLAGGLPVAQVAHAGGFADQAHLSKHFLAAYAITPGRWRRAHR